MWAEWDSKNAEVAKLKPLQPYFGFAPKESVLFVFAPLTRDKSVSWMCPTSISQAWLF